MRVQSVAIDPLQFVAADRLRFSRDETTGEEFQADGFLRVGVGKILEEFTDGDLDAQFLAEFANEALLKGFVRFTFSAGEFPQATEMRVRVAPGDEKLAGAKDEAGGNFNRLFHRPMLL